MSQITKGRVSRSLKGNIATLRRENGNADTGNIRDINQFKNGFCRADWRVTSGTYKLVTGSVGP